MTIAAKVSSYAISTLSARSISRDSLTSTVSATFPWTEETVSVFSARITWKALSRLDESGFLNARAAERLASIALCIVSYEGYYKSNKIQSEQHVGQRIKLLLVI